jgi:hypothetical protein
MYFMAGINRVIKPHTVLHAQRIISEAISHAASPRFDSIGFAIYNLLSTLAATETGVLSRAENLRMAISATIFALIEWEYIRRKAHDPAKAQLLKEALEIENEVGNTQEVELVIRISKLYAKNYAQEYRDSSLLPVNKSQQLYRTLTKHIPLELDRLQALYIDFVNGGN